MLFDSSPTIDQVSEFAKISRISVGSREPETVKRTFVKSCRLLSTKLYVRLAKIERKAAVLSSKEEADEILERMKGTDFGEYLATMRHEASEGNTEKLTELFNAFNMVLQSKPGNEAE